MSIAPNNQRSPVHTGSLNKPDRINKSRQHFIQTNPGHLFTPQNVALCIVPTRLPKSIHSFARQYTMNNNQDIVEGHFQVSMIHHNVLLLFGLS